MDIDGIPHLPDATVLLCNVYYIKLARVRETLRKSLTPES